MQITKSVTTTLAALLLSAAPALAADAPAVVPPSFGSDGSVLNESFNGSTLPKGWDSPDSGGNAREVTFKDGAAIFKVSKGDNFIELPKVVIDLDKPFAVEITFSIPSPTAEGFTIFTIGRVGGEFKIPIYPSERGPSLNIPGTRTLGVVESSKTYTVVVVIDPDGSFKATLAGGSIEKPLIVTGKGPEGLIKTMLLGNTRGLAEGGLRIEEVKIGLPTTASK